MANDTDRAEQAALIYLKGNDWTRSIRVLERLWQLNPQDVVLRRDLGVCFIRRGQPGKAIDHLRSYLEHAAEADDAEQVRAALDGALNTVAQWN